MECCDAVANMVDRGLPLVACGGVPQSGHVRAIVSLGDQYHGIRTAIGEDVWEGLVAEGDLPFQQTGLESIQFETGAQAPPHRLRSLTPFLVAVGGLAWLPICGGKAVAYAMGARRLL